MAKESTSQASKCQLDLTLMGQAEKLPIDPAETVRSREQAWWQEFMFKIQGSHMCPSQINQVQLSNSSKQHQSVSCIDDSAFMNVI